MASGLLGQIANPAQADIIGAMDKGKKRQAMDMAGEIMGQTQYGKLGALFRTDPELGMKVQGALGIPKDAKGRADALKGAYTLANQFIQGGDTETGIAVLEDYANTIEGSSQGTVMAEKTRAGIEALRSGDPDAANNINTIVNSFSGKTVSEKEQAETRKLIAEADALEVPSVVKPVIVAKGASIYDPDTKTFISSPGTGTSVKIPSSLINGLPEDMGVRVADAYSAAGGGKDGMQAAQTEKKNVQEDMRRDDASKSLAITYPNASTDEMAQLQTAVNYAPTVEKGMENAANVRSNQKATQKASVMTDRSLELINHILDNDQLADVVGSSEGKFGGSEQPSGVFPFIGGFISDGEAEAIADIEEVTNILTVPAMEIMTGILSESDLKLLKTISGGAFNRTRGIDRFKKDAGQIRTILQRASTIGKMKNPKDREAAIWATNKSNFNNPDAKLIRTKLGLK
tara:strand:- start:1757 stop:3133 length:1377 start_codon:yes stop_codon:yes gene_type:complete